jgi:hypothetical protein
MTLHPQQIKERERMIKLMPYEAERMAFAISVAKAATHMACYLDVVSEYVEVPKEIMYKVALVLNSCMAIWDEENQTGEPEFAEYKTQLSKIDIDDRFQKVFNFIFEEAIKRGWVKNE